MTSLPVRPGYLPGAPPSNFNVRLRLNQKITLELGWVDCVGVPRIGLSYLRVLTVILPPFDLKVYLCTFETGARTIHILSILSTLRCPVGIPNVLCLFGSLLALYSIFQAQTCHLWCVHAGLHEEWTS